VTKLLFAFPGENSVHENVGTRILYFNSPEVEQKFLHNGVR